MYCKISSDGGLMIQSWCEMTRLCVWWSLLQPFQFYLWPTWPIVNPSVYQPIMDSSSMVQCSDCRSGQRLGVLGPHLYIYTVYLQFYTVYLCADSVSIRHSPTAQRSVAHRPSPSPHAHTTPHYTVNNAMKHQNYFHRKIYIFYLASAIWTS